MMHYFDSGYDACLYDVYTRKYLNAVYEQYLEYDLEDHSDIPIQWIGSTAVLDGSSPTGSCYFNTNVNMEETTDASVGFEINASIHDPSPYVTYTLFHTSPEIVELDDVGGHIRISNRVDVINSKPTMYYGVYNRNASISEDPLLASYTMMELSYGEMLHDKPTRISAMPIKSGSVHTAAIKVQGNGKSGSREQRIIKTGSSNVFLFKNMNNNSAAQGIRLFSFSKFKNNGTFAYTNNLVPVLHFTGTKEDTMSNEGIKAPSGYVPCLYDTITQEYCYPEGGKPTWGFKHDSERIINT